MTDAALLDLAQRMQHADYRKRVNARMAKFAAWFRRPLYLHGRVAVILRTILPLLLLAACQSRDPAADQAALNQAQELARMENEYCLAKVTVAEVPMKAFMASEMQRYGEIRDMIAFSVLLSAENEAL